MCVRMLHYRSAGKARHFFFVCLFSHNISTAGITGGKHNSGPASHNILSNPANLPYCSSSSFPTTSLSILSLLLLYYLGVGVKGALISFCRLETTHELMLVSLGNCDMSNSSTFTSICIAQKNYLLDSCHPVHPWLCHSLSLLLVIPRNCFKILA